MTVLVYDGVEYPITGDPAGVSLIKQGLALIANSGEIQWLPLGVIPSGQRFFVLAGPGIPMALMTDPGFEELSVEETLSAFSQREPESGGVLLHLLRERVEGAPKDDE